MPLQVIWFCISLYIIFLCYIQIIVRFTALSSLMLTVCSKIVVVVPVNFPFILNY